MLGGIPILLALALTQAPCAQEVATESSLRELLQSAEAKEARGDSEGALEDLTVYIEAVESNPTASSTNLAQAYTLLGKNKAWLGRFEEALEAFNGAFEEGLEREEDWADLHFFRGRTHGALRRYSEALEDFKMAHALGVSLRYPEIHMYLGDAHFDLKLYEGAVESYYHFLEEMMNHDTPEEFTELILHTLYSSGIAQINRGHYLRALEDLTLALAFDNLDPHIHGHIIFYLGLAHYHLEEYDKAYENLTKATSEFGEFLTEGELTEAQEILKTVGALQGEVAI